MPHFDILQLDQNRLPRPLANPKPKPQIEMIGRMPTIDAIGALAEYCLSDHDDILLEGGSPPFAVTATRRLGAFSIAMEMADAPGVEKDTETWVREVRITDGIDPLLRAPVLTVNLPFGVSKDETQPYLNERKDAFISYPLDALPLQSRRIPNLPDLLYIDVDHFDEQMLQASGGDTSDFSLTEVMDEYFEHTKNWKILDILSLTPPSILIADFGEGAFDSLTQQSA